MASPQKRIRILPQTAWEDDFSRRNFITASILWLSSLSLILFLRFKLPPQVPLFYSRPWGEEQLTSPHSLFLLPGVIFVILLINLVAGSFFSEEKLILRILALTGALSAFFGFFALIKILALSL